MTKFEELAKFFHETYEKLAPEFGYKTRKASAKPWQDVPENNRHLMTAVACAVYGHLGIATLQSQLTAAQEALRWIPVGERLPETRCDIEGPFLVRANGVIRLATYAFSDKTWASRSGLIIYPTEWRHITLPARDETNP